MPGADADASAKVICTLPDLHGGAVALKRVVASQYQANPSDATFVSVRRHLACEGAVANNIELFLDTPSNFHPEQ